MITGRREIWIEKSDDDDFLFSRDILPPFPSNFTVANLYSVKYSTPSESYVLSPIDEEILSKLEEINEEANLKRIRFNEVKLIKNSDVVYHKILLDCGVGMAPHILAHLGLQLGCFFFALVDDSSEMGS